MNATLYLDFHILQTLPASNVNRDQSGRPKVVNYGGVERARVSSQAWKRATRLAFHSSMPEVERALRTKRIIEKVADRVEKTSDLTFDEALTRAEAALKKVKLSVAKEKPKKAAAGTEANAPTVRTPLTEYLLFVSNRQIDRLAQLVSTIEEPKANEVKGALDVDHGIEVALFGRMVADEADFNVDAACQVAHAMSTHAVRTQFDYFTAVDDANPEGETGAGMIGTIEFNSSTLYRYATLNVDQLLENLGSTEATIEAVRAFTECFATSMPTGKQNTFANRTTPDALVVMGRLGRPVNLVGAFEDAVKNEGVGYVPASAIALAEHAADIDQTFGPAPEFTHVTATARAAAVESLAPSTSLTALVEGVVADVRERLKG